MLKNTAIALSMILTVGGASSSLADFEYDGTGKPINMHLVQTPTDVFASARAAQKRAVAPFTAEEKLLFDRTSKPYHEGWTGR